jgi:hypothetical protein
VILAIAVSSVDLHGAKHHKNTKGQQDYKREENAKVSLGTYLYILLTKA